MRTFLILTLCASMLLSSNPIQIVAQQPTLNAPAGSSMTNLEFRRLIISKARQANMTLRQRTRLRMGLAFFGEEIQQAVEVRLAYNGQGIGDGDIDWAKLLEQIIEFIVMLLELFGTIPGSDSGIIIGEVGSPPAVVQRAHPPAGRITFNEAPQFGLTSTPPRPVARAVQPLTVVK